MLYWKDSLAQSVQGSLWVVYCLYLHSVTFIYPNYLTFSMPRKHQDVLLHLLASQHASLAVLTHNPLRSGRQVTYVTVRHANINKAEIAEITWQLTDRWQMEAHLSVSTMFFVLQNVVRSIQEQEGQRSRCTVTSPHCVHTAGNSVYFVSAAAARTEDTNK